MTLDEAITELKTQINSLSPEALIQIVRVSDEEARLSIYAPAAHLETLQNATRDKTIQLLTAGLDVQVFVYDKDATKIPE